MIRLAFSQSPKLNTAHAIRVSQQIFSNVICHHTKKKIVVVAVVRRRCNRICSAELMPTKNSRKKGINNIIIALVCTVRCWCVTERHCHDISWDVVFILSKLSISRPSANRHTVSDVCVSQLSYSRVMHVLKVLERRKKTV